MGPPSEETRPSTVKSLIVSFLLLWTEPELAHHPGIAGRGPALCVLHVLRRQSAGVDVRAPCDSLRLRPIVSGQPTAARPLVPDLSERRLVIEGIGRRG